MASMKQGKVFSGEDDESDEEEEEEIPWVSSPPISSTPAVVSTTSEPDIAKPDEPVISIVAEPVIPEEPKDVWTASLEGKWTESDGKRKMGLAAASHLQSVLDGSLHQIAELADSQKHLLNLVQERNVHLLRNGHLATIEQTLAQVPAYFQKVVQLKHKMNDITLTLEKLKSRADYLQVEAQSRALAIEEKRDKTVKST
ncbi:hypothetical protein Ae201684P_009017 [Aphanomyces euteiches]|uniref:Uncharacterized protein n=1 Tax=Aphanomyces euteiches TaxID=100861 RepID=A0A6G0WEM0_9STRA|nr:hypothetical protein Ae201684_015857 [Aphanomyces euteiches]KAH9080071.1 hypothetical protein Ae201684P_009017 [Aphanomyces euteiches]KAH9144307.1 hypothetical protein AeRB84_011731 [Aphanomyces euteiches]